MPMTVVIWFHATEGFLRAPDGQVHRSNQPILCPCPPRHRAECGHALVQAHSPHKRSSIHSSIRPMPHITHEQSYNESSSITNIHPRLVLVWADSIHSSSCDACCCQPAPPISLPPPLPISPQLRSPTGTDTDTDTPLHFPLPSPTPRLSLH